MGLFSRLSTYVFLLAVGACALLVSDVQAAPSGSVVGTITLRKDGNPKADRSGVVVYLELGDKTQPELDKRRVAISQHDLAFAPSFNVVRKGTTIAFPNDDKVFHNVFSLSQPARFDLGLYKSGDEKSVTFSRPGVVDIYCNIHPQMVAKVIVLDTYLWAVTGKDGSFKITGVPDGDYPVVAWERNGGKQTGTASVKNGGAANIALTVDEGAGAAANHTRKDGTPYGRYQ
jgi:plastocyanin